MANANVRRYRHRIERIIFGALVVANLTTVSGAAAAEIEPATAAENQLVKLGHRYFMDEQQMARPTPPENHRIGWQN